MECKYPCEQSELQSFSLALELLKSLNRDDLAVKASVEGASVFLDIPMDYNEPDTNRFRDAYWVSESFSKMPWKLPGVNREETAYQKFWDAEEVCRRYNSRLVDALNRASLDVRLLKRARQRVASVLGDFSWNECYPHFSFGPGASTSLPRRKAQRPNKWLGGHITEGCLPLYLAFCRYNTGWKSVPLTVVQGNRVTTVPKSAKTDRVIAIEPDWNMFFQRGIGGAIRHRLRRRLGLLKPDAQDTHKYLAQQGSLSGQYSTIDLKAASDTVSVALVEALLPDDWYQALMLTRSPVGLIQGKTVTYEKISSMGNGFTFELETLLFWALCSACCSSLDLLSVYGDDIVVSRERATQCIELLQSCGFDINESKTFVDGPFRESCGGHFHLGADVTPPYFRRINTGSIPHLMRDANNIKRRAVQRYGGFLDDRLFGVWDSLAKRVPSRFYGPESLGDAVLNMPFDATRPRRAKRFCAYYVEGLFNVRENVRADHMGGVNSSLWFKVTEESQYKTGIGLYRRQLAVVERWADSAPWLGAGT